MPEWNMNQEFKLKKIDKIRNYFSEEINQNELMSKKNKKFVDHSLIAISAIAGCVSISAFCFFSCKSYRNRKFYNRTNNLCNGGRK